MSATLALTHANLALPEGLRSNATLIMTDGIITDILPEYIEGSATSVIDLNGQVVLPGFIDLHVHGAMGYDTMDASSEALEAMAQFYAQHGVTSFLATTWTDTDSRIMAALQTARDCVGRTWQGAQLLGVHLEGPYLATEKAGAQNPVYVRTAHPEEALRYLDLNVIRLLSLAPEIKANQWLIPECTQQGITVSLAHSSATYEETLLAVEMGLTHATHTFNAMTPLHHRQPGAVGAIMASSRIRAELIADNVHVHPIAMNVLYQTKGENGVVLISDSIRAAGMPDGEYEVDDRVMVVEGGVCRLKDGSLSGSTLTLDHGLRNFAKAVGQPFERLWRVVSLNPAQAIGYDNRKGSLEVGKDADLVVLNPQGEVQQTFVMGRCVYQKEM